MSEHLDVVVSTNIAGHALHEAGPGSFKKKKELVLMTNNVHWRLAFARCHQDWIINNRFQPGDYTWSWLRDGEFQLLTHQSNMEVVQILCGFVWLLVISFIDGFTLGMKFQSIVYLLSGNVRIYIGYWTLKATQYNICGQAAFKNARTMFSSKSSTTGACNSFQSGSESLSFLGGCPPPIQQRHVHQSPTLGAHTHAHGFWVGMGSILLFMGEHGLKQSTYWAWVQYVWDIQG